MLNHLHVTDFAIIDDTEVEPGSGMTALTGETGAGKSILLDALGLVLGARASAGEVREGATRAEITASFDVDEATLAWLRERELDADDECLLRRTVGANGKSRASVNGHAVTAQVLRELGARLVAVHGQNAQHDLARGAEQRRLLDAWKPSAHAATVARAFDAWRAAEGRLAAVLDESATRAQRIDLLRFQLQEFDELDTGGASVADIENEHRWLANVERLAALGAEALGALETEAEPALGAALRPLEAFARLDADLQEAVDLVQSASIQVAEAASLLNHRTSALEHDDARLAWLDARIATLHRLAKKHRCEPAELGAVEQALRDELDALTGDGQGPEALEAARDAALAEYLNVATKLSRHRKRAATELGRVVTESMQGLAMEGGRFRVALATDPARRERHGIDRIAFEVAPNPGTTPAPLGKVASGGELSRIALALQLATIEAAPVPTLIFDEVDAGIGGAVADTVGRLLREVGEHAQVLCVTHLAQVAARAHGHLRVTKRVADGRTRTELEALDARATKEEIARMLGGARVTKKSLQHAAELLADAG